MSPKTTDTQFNRLDALTSPLFAGQHALHPARLVVGWAKMPDIRHKIGRSFRAAFAAVALILGSVCPALGLGLITSESCGMSCCASRGVCCCHMRQQSSTNDTSPERRRLDRPQLGGSCPGGCNGSQSNLRTPRADGAPSNPLGQVLSTEQKRAAARSDRPDKRSADGCDHQRAPPCFS